ncbi:MAG TPA: response regulator transcription factor [Streptosporangiaceae bacterium]|jgi:DNA-binding NarL/FixJ family response regulator
MTIRVLLVDDQPLVRAGLRTLLGTQPDIEVAGEAGDGAAALAEVARLRPDVVLMDVRMPGTDGIEATARISATADGPRVLILTTYDLDEYVFEALAAGASGFLLKDARPEDLVEGVRIVASGEALLAPSVTRKLIGIFARDGRPGQGKATAPAPPPAAGLGPATVDELTEREQEVLRLVVRGLSNAEIGAALHITDHTVKTHVAHILAKLGLRDRVHAVIFAYERRLAGAGVQPAGA